MLDMDYYLGTVGVVGSWGLERLGSWTLGPLEREVGRG